MLLAESHSPFPGHLPADALVSGTSDSYASMRTGAGKLLGAIGNYPRWRYEVLARLSARLTGEKFDFVQCAKRVIATITGGPMPP